MTMILNYQVVQLWDEYKSSSQVFKEVYYLELISINCWRVFEYQLIMYARLYRIFYKFTNTHYINKMNTESTLKIGTHNGIFHCDQVTACTLLTRYSDKFKGAQIIRTRDQKILDQCDIVVDVGGKHQPPKYLDHHQREFEKTHPQHPKIKLSSAGLVYWQFPQLIPNIIKKVLDVTQHLTFVPANNKEIQKQVQDQVYEKLILPIDGNDNGVESRSQGTKNYSTPGSIWSRIGRLNPSWWQQNVDEMERFKKAMDVADQELIHTVKSIFLGPIQTYDLVKRCFDQRAKHHQSGEIVVLDKIIPWKESLFAVQKKEGKQGVVKFVIFPQSGNSKKWRVQAMPKEEGSFDLRKGLKKQWRGIKDMQLLKQASGIQDIVFVHMNGFIGGAQSFQSTLKMSVISLQSQ